MWYHTRKQSSASYTRRGYDVSNTTGQCHHPNLQSGHIIERAIRSVLNQTYPNLEICVVDDASTDNTAEVVTAISDPRLHYIRLTQNQGGGGARNVGIEATTGMYIAFLDSDDEWLPPMLERLLTYLMQADRRVGAVYCDYYSTTMSSSRSASPARPCTLGAKSTPSSSMAGPKPSLPSCCAAARLLPSACSIRACRACKITNCGCASPKSATSTP